MFIQNLSLLQVETSNDNSSVSSNVSKGFGQVKGQFTYQYNKVIGTRGDNGAKIILIPKNSNVKSFNNGLAVSGISEEYESGILVKQCDGYGNFDFGDSVPAGEYVCVVISKNTTSSGRFNNETSWKKDIKSRLNEYLSESDLDKIMLTMGYQSIVIDDIEVENGKVLTLTNDFGYTYIQYYNKTLLTNPTFSYKLIITKGK